MNLWYTVEIVHAPSPMQPKVRRVDIRCPQLHRPRGGSQLLVRYPTKASHHLATRLFTLVLRSHLPALDPPREGSIRVCCEVLSSYLADYGTSTSRTNHTDYPEVAALIEVIDRATDDSPNLIAAATPVHDNKEEEVTISGKNPFKAHGLFEE
jgi:hypothetical protein